MGTIRAINPVNYKFVTYDHHLSTPDTVGSAMVSEKIRFDEGTIQDNILSPFIRSEESALDRQPPDFSNLGIFFSPTFEINEDIVYKMGGFRLDDYIGDPRHLKSSSYVDLESGKKEYFSNVVTHRYNFFDYIRTVQHFDHTLFKIIEEFVPAKANLKTGLVIEPHYFERNKFTYANPDFTNISFPDIEYKSTLGNLSAEYLIHSTSINVEEVLDGSAGSFENNFVHSTISKKYFRVANNR